MKIHRGFKLNVILVCLSILTVSFTVFVCTIAAHQAIQQSLTSSYLENNQQYSQKLAFSTKTLLQNMQNDLTNTADSLKKYPQKELQHQLDKHWQSQQKYFNSMLYVDNKLKVLAVSSPFSTVHIGDTMNTTGFIEANKRQKPYISDPYIGVTGKTLILVTAPIFDNTGQYQGLLSGTIYLQEQNALHSTLMQNFYNNGSYVYVINRNGQIIFHPDINQISKIEEKNIVNQITHTNSGANKFITDEKEPVLVGYTLERSTHWSIIVATPGSIVKSPTNELVLSMIKLAFPFFITILFISILLAFRITKPLYTLAKFSENIINRKGNPNIQIPHINSGIYEVRQLSQNLQLAVKEIQHHISQLDIAVQTDALTGIANRRTFNLSINEQIANQIPFSLIFLDIDFFKKVNDTFGHVVGDEVLKFLAQMMQRLSRKGDMCFRYGGEEFAIIVPYGDRDTAFAIAERLRTQLENTPSPTGDVIHISLGIAIHPDHGKNENDLIAAADQAMYSSKTTGRNKTTLYATNESNKK